MFNQTEVHGTSKVILKNLDGIYSGDLTVGKTYAAEYCGFGQFWIKDDANEDTLVSSENVQKVA